VSKNISIKKELKLGEKSSKVQAFDRIKHLKKLNAKFQKRTVPKLLMDLR